MHMDALAPLAPMMHGGISDRRLEPFLSVMNDKDRPFSPNATWRIILGEVVDLIDHDDSSNVLDNASSISLTVEAWDYDSDDSHDPINVGSSNATTLTYAAGGYIGWFEWFTLSGSTSPRVVNLKVHVSTVTPVRNPVFLVVPSDYAGVYNVTLAGGLTTSRRYVGEPKFYAIFVNVTDAAYGYDGVKETWLVPRSVFMDTYLYTRLNKASNMTGTWLSDSANQVQFSQNSSAGTGTAALDGTLTAHLDVAEWTTMIDWLRKNVSGGLAHTDLRVDWEPSVGDYFFLLGLPDSIVQLASYQPLPNTPTTTYKFDYRPVWQRIWDGTISAALAWIASGFVAAANFMANLPAMLAQLGAWLWNGIVEAAEAVASAVQAAAKALEQLVDAVMSFVEDIVRRAIDFLVRPLLEMLRQWTGELLGIIERILDAGDTNEQDVLVLDNVLFNSGVALLANVLAIGIQVVIGIVTVLSIVLPGAQAVSAIIKKVILEALKAAAEHWLASSLITLGAAAIVGAIIPKDSPVWAVTSAIGTLVTALLVIVVQKVVAERLNRVSKFLDGDRYGLFVNP